MLGVIRKRTGSKMDTIILKLCVIMTEHHINNTGLPLPSREGSEKDNDNDLKHAMFSKRINRTNEDFSTGKRDNCGKTWQRSIKTVHSDRNR